MSSDAPQTPLPPVSRADLGVLVFCVLLGAALRLAALGHGSLTVDEGVSLHMARLPVGTLSDVSLAADGPVSVLHFVTRFDAHPPLFYLALHAWTGLVGEGSEGLVRLPSALFSVASLWAACLLFLRLLPTPVARVAMVMAACSQASVWCAQEVRMYPMLEMFVFWAAWCGVRAWRDDWRAGWIAWSLLSLAAAYTHYLGLFAVVAFVLWTVVTPAGQPRASRHRWTSVLAVGAGLLPWVPVVLAQTRGGHGPPALAGVGAARMLENVPPTIIDLVWGPSLPLRLPPGIAMGAVAALTLLLVAWGGWRAPRAGARLAALQAALPVLLLLTVGLLLGRGLVQPRFFMYLAPFVALLLASLWTARGGRAVVGGVLLVNALSLGTWYTDEAFQRQPLRSAALALRAAVHPQDLVLVEDAIGVYPLRFYLSAEACPALVGAHPVRIEDGSLETFTKGRRTVWLVLADAWVVDPDNRVFGWLAAHMTPTGPPLVVPNHDPSHAVVVFRFDARL